MSANYNPDEFENINMSQEEEDSKSLLEAKQHGEPSTHNKDVAFKDFILSKMKEFKSSMEAVVKISQLNANGIASINDNVDIVLATSSIIEKLRNRMEAEREVFDITDIDLKEIENRVEKRVLNKQKTAKPETLKSNKKFIFVIVVLTIINSIAIVMLFLNYNSNANNSSVNLSTLKTKEILIKKGTKFKCNGFKNAISLKIDITKKAIVQDNEYLFTQKINGKKYECVVEK